LKNIFFERPLLKRDGRIDGWIDGWMTEKLDLIDYRYIYRSDR
jgi:hypothetical protein